MNPPPLLLGCCFTPPPPSMLASSSTHHAPHDATVAAQATGAANPEFVGDLVDVNIVTPVGTIPLVLKSVLTVAGLYEGTLKLDGLGTEIPLNFGIDVFARRSKKES
jgi:hypothetical protein